MLYTQDSHGKDILLQDGKNSQVMMEWEIPYMNALIDNVKPKDMDVLEIGYGLGYSAKRIQSYNPKSHTVIECDKNVITKAKKDNLNIEIVEGRWQDVLHTLGNYDFIFLDDHSYEDYSNELEEAVDRNRCSMFVDICIDWHLNKNGVISFYCNKDSSLIDKFSSNYKIKYVENSIKIDIPDNCKYRLGNICIIPKLILVNNNENTVY